MNIHINMQIFIMPGIKVFSGRKEGSFARRKLELDKHDDSDETIYITIPQIIWSMNSSFFLSCFGDSIRKLGKEAFEMKYIFICDPVIEKQIKEGIIQALKTSNVLGYLGGN